MARHKKQKPKPKTSTTLLIVLGILVFGLVMVVFKLSTDGLEMRNRSEEQDANRTSIRQVSSWYSEQATDSLMQEYVMLYIMGQYDGITRVELESGQFFATEDLGIGYTYFFNCYIGGELYYGYLSGFIEYKGTEWEWFSFEIYHSVTLEELYSYFDASIERKAIEYYKDFIEPLYN